MMTNQHPSRTRGSRMAAGAIGTFTLVIGLLAAAALAAPDEDPAPAQAEQEAAEHRVEAAETPKGTTPVAGPEGAPVGYISNAELDLALQEGEPPLGIDAAGVELRGFRVRSAQGKVVGYFLSGDTGFLSLERAADPKVLEAVAFHWIEEQKASQEAAARAPALVPGG